MSEDFIAGLTLDDWLGYWDGELYKGDGLKTVEDVLPDLRAAVAEIRRLSRYRSIMENCHGDFIYQYEKILNHFDEHGNIKGDGKWRLAEIYGCVKAMDDASGVAVRLFNNPSEPVPKASDDPAFAVFAKSNGTSGSPPE